MCGISRLVLYTARLGLLAAWLVLAGMKVKHFLSEPTVLQPRVDRLDRDDRKFDKMPYVSVFTDNGFHDYLSYDLSDRYERVKLSNQTLIEFITSHSLSLAELSGQSGLLSEEERKRRMNQTTIEDEYNNKWSVTLDALLSRGATRVVDRNALLTLPRYKDFMAPKDKPTVGKAFGGDYYRLHFHGRSCFFAFASTISSAVMIENAISIATIELKIERLENLNLRREPCEEDPAYEYEECIRKWFLNGLNCSLYGNEKGRGKPTCMAYDMESYKYYFNSFFLGSGGSIPLFQHSGCRQSCIQDSISYSYMDHKSEGFDSFFGILIYVNPVRHTQVMVLTYGLEDLLADTGGYLGLLLGASLLSLIGYGRKLFRRLKQALAKQRQQTDKEGEQQHHTEAAWRLFRRLGRQALPKRLRRRRRRQQADKEEEQHPIESVWKFNGGEAAFDDKDYVSVHMVHPDFYSRFVQRAVITEDGDVDGT